MDVGQTSFCSLTNDSKFAWKLGLVNYIVDHLCKNSALSSSAASLKSMAKMRTLQPEMARIKSSMVMIVKKPVRNKWRCLKSIVLIRWAAVFLCCYRCRYLLRFTGCYLNLLKYAIHPDCLDSRSLSQRSIFILPLIMGASMFLMQKLQPAPTDPMQAKVFQCADCLHVLLLMFPAGLVLYWTVNNLLSILQQWIVNRQIAAAANNKKPFGGFFPA